MTHITAADANAWSDKAKLDLDSLDSALEDSLTVQTFSQLAQVYDPTPWIDNTTTPPLVKKILSMQYVGWYYERAYSEDEDISNYGMLLIAQAQKLIDGIIAGIITIPGQPSTGFNPGQPAYYPTDASSALIPTIDDMSLGDAKFSMGTVW